MSTTEKPAFLSDPATKPSEDDKNYAKPSFWFDELLRADRHEQDWRDMSLKIIARYRQEQPTRKDDVRTARYNVLFANVDVLQGVLYQQPPSPDVRPRYKKKDQTALLASTMLEKCLDFSIDDGDLDNVMRAAVQERLLVGRAVAKVRYSPEIAEVTASDGSTYDQVMDEQVRVDNVPYNLFRYSPARTWKEVWWVAFGELLSRADLEEQFPKVGGRVSLDWTATEEDSTGKKNEDAANDEDRALVWTVWCKRDKRVYVLTTGFKDDFLTKPQDDPLHLRQFFPCPEPLYGIRSPLTLVPVPDFLEYQDQAVELNEITDRISKLIRELKRRGIYDASIPELQRLATANDNEFIPVQNYAAIAEKGVENALIELPIEGISKVVLNLYKQRDDILNIIYAITGISDILRGTSLASESATAQNIKAQYANSRVGPWQRQIARFARAILELQAEIMAEHFSSETLQQMSGVDVPTAQQITLANQVAQAKQEQPPPATPSLEEVMALLRNEKMRGFRVDIETDSTIVSKESHAKQELTDFTTSVATLIQSLSPAVESGFIPPPAAREILLSATRKFEFGKDIDEAMNAAGEYQPPDPEAAAKATSEAQAKTEMEKTQAELASREKIAMAEIQSKEKIAMFNSEHDRDMEQDRHNNEQQLKSMEVFGQSPVEGGEGTPFQLMQGMVQGMAQLGQQLAQLGQALGMISAQNELLVRAVSAPTVIIRDENNRIIGAQKAPIIQ